MSNPNSIIIYNNNLCPEIWDEYFQLHPDIRLNLLNIAKEFYEKTTFEAPIIDILFMGSLASFNWNKQSDIDVHILIDLTKLNMPEETADKMYKVVGSQWNSEHDIQIKNHKVEMNIQPTKVEKPYVNGIYSLIKNQWIKKPTREDPKAINKSIIQVKYNGLKKYIIDTIYSKNIDKMKEAKDYIDSFRQYGLDTNGELSVENIVYKLLRTKGIIKILKDEILKIYDKSLSINEEISEDRNNAKTKNFELRFGDPRVNKTAGLITLNGTIWFANCFLMQGMNDELLGWVINTHQGAWDLDFPKENIKFENPHDLLNYIQAWYDKKGLTEISQSDINQRHPQFVIQDKNGIPNLKLLTLDNLKALRDKCVRMAKNIKPDEDKYGIRKRATQDFVLYQNEIKRRLEIINRPLMENEDKNYDATHDFFERKR